MLRKLLLIGLFCFPTLIFAQTLNIIQKPIIWNREREQLSVEYLKDRHGIIQNNATITPTMIVVHWTDVLSLEKTFKLFDRILLPGRPELTKASKLNVSAQYIIDRDGRIYQLLPDTVFARHTIGLNYCAIGIENIGSEKNPLTKKQLLANENLIRSLSERYNIEYVIGHLEYERFRDTPVWKETDASYITFKTDPGHLFMYRLRKRIRDLNLKERYE